MLPSDEFELPKGGENEGEGDEEAEDGFPQVDSLVGRVGSQKGVMAQDTQIGEVAQSCLADVGESALMEDFFDRVWGTFSYQIIDIDLRVCREVCDISIRKEWDDLRYTKNNRSSLY